MADANAITNKVLVANANLELNNENLTSAGKGVVENIAWHELRSTTDSSLAETHTVG